jgi:TRAP-type C4-dicarboxylate transport system substrate-binding protein
MTVQQALNIVYSAARLAALPAKDHEAVYQAAELIAKVLNQLSQEASSQDKKEVQEES